MHCRGLNSLQRLLRLRQGFKKHLQHTTLQPIFSSILATTGHSWTQLLVVARGPSLLKHDLRKQGNVYSYAPLEGTKHKGITGDVKNSERDRHLIYNVCVQHPCIKPWKGSRSDVYSSPMTLSSKSNVGSQLTERPVCRMQAPAWIKKKHIRISSASIDSTFKWSQMPRACKSQFLFGIIAFWQKQQTHLKIIDKNSLRPSLLEPEKKLRHQPNKDVCSRYSNLTEGFELLFFHLYSKNLDNSSKLQPPLLDEFHWSLPHHHGSGSVPSRISR